MKVKHGILIFLLTVVSILTADFIVPRDDPVYTFIAVMHNLGYAEEEYFIYPQYYNGIIAMLEDLRAQDLPSLYKRSADRHYKRLVMEFPEGINSAVYPLKNIPVSVVNILRPASKKHLATYHRNECSLFLSGILGIDYDIRSADDRSDYRYDYYSWELAGNIKQNFGFYTRYRKGHFKGDLDFILENEQVHWSGSKPRLASTFSEVDYKNSYLNLSIGFGSFSLGKTITSSLVLNSDITPYGYLKYYKDFGNFHYLGMNSQLLPDSLTSSSEYSTKSYALQTIYYSKDAFSIGFGQAVVYGDRTFDLAYSTPLVVFKIIDYKRHARDNQVAFLFSSLRLVPGLVLYENFFIDDIRKERLITREWLSYLASQTGIIYNLPYLPLQITTEATAVGPGTYGHSSVYNTQTQYRHDNQLLGYTYGSNLLNLAAEIMFFTAELNVSMKYENIQQGSIG
ncbi:hypothetical protein ACFLYK_04780, partial [Candidatus Cloacimonadota bacterium]